MSTLTARSSSIQNATKSGLVPVLDDAAWLAKFLARKPPPVPVVHIPEPPKRRTTAIPKPPTEIWFLSSPGSMPDDDMAHAALSSVARSHGVSLDDIRGHVKTAILLTARREAIIAIRSACPAWTASRIARFLNRDHTTILSALKRLNSNEHVLGLWRVHNDTARIAAITGLTEAEVTAIIASDQDRRDAARARAHASRIAYDRGRYDKRREYNRAYNTEWKRKRRRAALEGAA